MNQTFLTKQNHGHIQALVDYILDDKELKDFEEYIQNGGDPKDHIAYHASMVGKDIFGYNPECFDIIIKYEENAGEKPS